MKQFNLVTLLFSLFLIQSCGIFRIRSGTDFEKSDVREIEFCNLTEHEDQLIKTRLIYTGVEEYWGASGFSQCKLNNNVSLNFKEYYEGWKWIFIDGQLNRVHNNYHKKKAIMTVIGVFEIDSTNGFGHLGSNIGQIVVKSVKINVKKK
jgi:hypothetical protein